MTATRSVRVVDILPERNGQYIRNSHVFEGRRTDISLCASTYFSQMRAIGRRSNLNHPLLIRAGGGQRG